MRSIWGTFTIILALGLGLTTLSCNTKSNPVFGTTPESIISIKANSSEMGPKAYSPSPDTVAIGTKVAWKNNDSMTHTATQSAGAFTWDTGKVSPGSRSIVVTMSTAGTYSYSCTIMMHRMAGILVVK